MVTQRNNFCPKLLVFDFDGVLTDNRVLVSSDGSEAVMCNRSDGLGFDLFHRYKVPVLILSTEKNEVVRRRAQKLRCPVVHGVGDKVAALKKYCLRKKIALRDVAYVGNDLNDLAVMGEVGHTFCPKDAHPVIRKLASRILAAKGGEGVAREMAERVLGLQW